MIIVIKVYKMLLGIKKNLVIFYYFYHILS